MPDHARSERAPRSRLAARWALIAVAAVGMLWVGRLVSEALMIRRGYLLARAASYEGRARVGDRLLGGVTEDRYRARCAEAARGYRRAARFPLLPDPPEPRFGE